MTPAADLSAWIEQEYRVAARSMLQSVSATGLEHRRSAFGQTLRPARGSIVASPVSAHYDPEPDYFFHWTRDAAVVIGAVIELIDDGTLGDAGREIVADTVRFSLALDRLDGRRLATDPAYGAAVVPGALRYLRPREEMAEVHGDRVRMEARYNPDGSLDILHWARPQFDGPASRAIVLMRYAARHAAFAELEALIDADVAFTLRHAGADGYDIWEERRGGDYYTHSLQHELLTRAATKDRSRGNRKQADAFTAATDQLADRLDGHWSDERCAYLISAHDGAPTDRDVDFAVVLAALHSERVTGSHSVSDPRMQATLATLGNTFAADYAINHDRPSAAPAMGRYRGDVYQSGGAFYFSTLGAAEFHYRLAVPATNEGVARTSDNAGFLSSLGAAGESGDPTAQANALIARGDAFMETVRQFTPASGSLSEQFDQRDGRPTSARELAWSYAAFITATAWRRRAVASLSGRHIPAR
jgi:glucoamylase